MNEITRMFRQSPVRIVRQDDAPWFVAKDVCDVLEIQKQANATRYLDEDERGVCLINTPSGDQQMTIINESGLYSLILRSRKPEAKAFKRWITHEVLPSIRKTGSYSVPGDADAKQRFLNTVYAKLAEDVNSVPPEVLALAREVGGVSPRPPRPPRRDRTLSAPKLSRTAQLTILFRGLPEIHEFLDGYREWTPRTEFVNAFYMKYADFVCGIDRCRWWDALQRLRPLERRRTPQLEYVRFR